MASSTSTSTSPPTPLAAASTLGYTWAAVMLLVSVVISLSVARQGASVGVMAVPIALSVASGVAAHGVRRLRWPYFALGVCAAWIAFLFNNQVKISLVGIAVNVLIFLLVTVNLRRFQRSG
jgi:hypothetical protein